MVDFVRFILFSSALLDILNQLDSMNSAGYERGDLLTVWRQVRSLDCQGTISSEILTLHSLVWHACKRNYYRFLLKYVMQALHKEERSFGKVDPMEKLTDKSQHMEMMDPPASDMGTLHAEHENAIQISDKHDSGNELELNEAEERPQYELSESANLRAALNAAVIKIEEQMRCNELLKEKLESGSQHLSKLREEHAQEVARRDESINHMKQLNLDLTHDKSETETTQAEIKSRYRSLATNLEQQFEDARKEVNIS
jgi:hypothetical protein